MEQTTTRSRLLSIRPSRWRVPAPLQQLYAEAAWLQQLVTEELQPRPGRIRTSMRMAFIGAVGAALMAALHVDSALGPATLWLCLFASSSLMTASQGLVLALALSVALDAAAASAGLPRE